MDAPLNIAIISRKDRKGHKDFANCHVAPWRAFTVRAGNHPSSRRDAQRAVVAAFYLSTGS